MADNETPPSASEVETVLRIAYRTLEDIAGDRVISEAGISISEVIDQFPWVVKQALYVATGQLGPLINWKSAPQRSWEPFIALHDFDNEVECVDGLEFDGSAVRGENDNWFESALYCAAHAYRRAAGWDNAPGEGGIWLLMLAPESHFGGGDDEWVHYRGHLVGFLIVHDRDEDGIYESVAHIWTASSWRRRGVAKRLLAEACNRFSIVEIEGPYTEDGSAFVNSCFVDQTT